MQLCLVLVNKAFKFKLKPSNGQMELLHRFAGCCRWAWNQCLADQNAHYESTGEALGAIEWKRRLSPLKREHAWLGDCHSQPLQEKILDLGKAWKAFFRRKRGDEGPPQFKRKGEGESFRYTQGVEIEGSRIRLPKIGWVRFRRSRDVQGRIKTANVRLEPDGWFVSVCCELEIEPQSRCGSEVGIDAGVNRVATLSTGEVEHFETPAWIEERITFWQRDLAKRKRGSLRWKHARRRIAKLSSKRARCRIDALHKLTTRISKSHAAVYVEDLKVKEMTASAKGTIEKPGRGVKRKSRLNRSMLDKSLGRMYTMLEYKQQWSGGAYVRCDPAYTSQQCSACGEIDASNRTGSLYSCRHCGHKQNADLNAAINILRAGQALRAAAQAA